MRILVVDDEPLARRRLCLLIAEGGLGEVVGEAGDGVAALEQVSSLAPDVILLDVRMPGMDGLEAARHLARLVQPPMVIFTTAYDDHALEAFDSRAVDYLLKPVRSERLAAALDRAAALVVGHRSLAPIADGGEGRQHVSAVASGTLRLMPLAEVYYFQADQGYVSAVGRRDRLLLEESLRALEEEFGDRFVRVHRNALVNVDAVRGLEKGQDGNTVVVFDGLEERLVVSRRMLATVRKMLRAR